MHASQPVRHFGVLPFTGTGHLIPFLALGQELRRRGHRVTFFEKSKIRERVSQAGFEFVAIAEKPPYARERLVDHRSGLRQEIANLRFNLDRIGSDIRHYLLQTPAILRRSGVDALIVNEIALTAPTVAQTLELPYFLISTSVPHSFGWKFSSWFLGYRYSASCLSWLQSAYLELSVLRVRGPIGRLIDQQRRQLGFGPSREIPRDFPPLAHLTQMPACLDRPHASLPTNFHYAGPFVSLPERPPVPFPWERLDGRPIIYASLGTTRNVQIFVLRKIAEGCKDLNVQLILSLGNRFEPAELGELAGQPLVVKYAPQLEILKIARAVITHGGANSVFEALLEGKPMIVIPQAYDQPAMAERLAQLHIAETLPVMRLSARMIRDAVTKVLHDRSYQDAAQRMQVIMSPPRGTERAARIIETCLDRYESSRICRSMPELFDIDCDTVSARC